MPNWCQNYLELSHEDATQMQRAADAILQNKLLQEFVPIEHEENWYDWCVNNWGTKWDIDVHETSLNLSDDKKSLTVAFDTAWSPPLAAMERMLDQGFNVRLMYSEEGVGFTGVFDNGCDDCYDTCDMTAAQLREELPAELDDMFGLSDSQQNYEDEEGEETDEND